MSQHEISISQNLPERLRAARQRAGLTQAQWAAKGGVSLGAQNRYESGATEPNASYFAGLHLAGIDILHLITGTPSGDALDPRTLDVVIRFQQLTPAMQEAVAVSVAAIAQASLGLPLQPPPAPLSLHDQRSKFRSDPEQ